MPRKKKTVFVCTECGFESAKWLGKCPSCGAWNSFVEKNVEPNTNTWIGETEYTTPTPLNKISISKYNKIPTEVHEVDRVLGGGITKSSYILLAGEPGIGKSTLLLQLAYHLSRHSKVLYVSGEESPEQIKARAERLLKHSTENILLLSEPSYEAIEQAVHEINPSFLIVDSIQTIYTGTIEQPPSSITQIRECGARLLRLTKRHGITTILIGHITKIGDIAGPKILEHMVDVVLLLEGDKNTGFRILRAQKNRFGPTDEVGIFEMTQEGLIPVENTNIFLHKTLDLPVGSTIAPVIEGSRVFLVEIQALCTQTPFSMPIRNVSGYDIKRLQILLAVIENNLSIHLRGMDIFLNITGGFKIRDTSTDLAVIGALLSSFRKKQPFSGIALIGEVGLTGEIRIVPKIRKRVDELKRFGFKGVILPKADIQRNDIQLSFAENIKEVYEQWF